MDASETTSFIKWIAEVLGTNYIQPVIYFVLFIILLLFFFFVGLINYQISKNNIKNKKEKKKLLIDVLQKILIEFICTFIISFLIIKLSNTTVEFYFLNWIFAPCMGYIISMMVYYKFFIPLIKKNKIKKNSETSIVVNIDNNPDGKFMGITNTELIPKFDEDSEEESHEEIFRNSINVLNSKQNEMQEELNMQSSILIAMQSSMKDEKKLWLKENIYKLLERGVATKFEDEQIRTIFKSYTSLGGNGEIKDLFRKYNEEIHFTKEN